jgi:RNA polymerase sigma-70 factor (ECF subfamily)
MIAELVSRARDGDAEAYTELVRRFQDAVYATAYQAVLDPEAARDLAQDTFVRAYEALGSLRDPASFPGWVIRICRNLAATWLRRPERAWVSLDGLHVPAPDIAPTVASDDFVARALSALPEENRLALSLFAVNGYTYDEVAELTGVPTTTVKGRIHRAKRKLAAEVFGMVEGSLKSSAPKEAFTLQTARRALDEARRLLRSEQLTEARSIAEDTLRELEAIRARDTEVQALRSDGQWIVRSAAFWADWDSRADAAREELRACEATESTDRVAELLDTLANWDRRLTETEKDALRAWHTHLLRRAGRRDEVGRALFYHGWRELERGNIEEGFARFDEARAALADLPYSSTHACLDAAQELRALSGGEFDVVRRALWGAGCALVRREGERLVYAGGYAARAREGRMEVIVKFEDALWMLRHVRWFPYTGPPVKHEEELDTHSQTENPTRTRVWIESDAASLTVPAGRFDNCLLMRATIAESPRDEGSESWQRNLNRIWLGERWVWFARGVGPVASRHERGDGFATHAVLSRFDCPERCDEWFPLVAGTRWEYVPADYPADFDALIVFRLTHLADDGNAYLATTQWGDRHE